MELLFAAKGHLDIYNVIQNDVLKNSSALDGLNFESHMVASAGPERTLSQDSHGLWARSSAGTVRCYRAGD